MKKILAIMMLGVCGAAMGIAQQPSAGEISPTVGPAPTSTGASTSEAQPTVSKVMVKLVVDKNGNPTKVRVVRGVNAELDQKAAEAVKKYRFTSAGVAVDFVIEVKFEIYPKGVTVPSITPASSAAPN